MMRPRGVSGQAGASPSQCRAARSEPARDDLGPACSDSESDPACRARSLGPGGRFQVGDRYRVTVTGTRRLAALARTRKPSLPG